MPARTNPARAQTTSPTEGMIHSSRRAQTPKGRPQMRPLDQAGPLDATTFSAAFRNRLRNHLVLGPSSSPPFPLKIHPKDLRWTLTPETSPQKPTDHQTCPKVTSRVPPPCRVPRPVGRA